MRLPRLILAALIATAVALAPIAGAFAAAAGAPPEQARVAAMDCHHVTAEAGQKSSPKQGHCPNCGIDGSCNAACLHKCFQLSATLEPSIVLLGALGEQLPLTIVSEPPSWSAKPPAPPPRA